ncbi:MAG: family 43 glycosylhydrolase [Breznakibacter sp.]
MKNIIRLMIFLFMMVVGHGAHGQIPNTKMVYGKPSAATVKYFNPILPDFVADPSVAMFNDTFYLYGTTDINQGLEKMGPPVVWKSTDFANWSFSGTLIEDIDWNTPYGYTDAKGVEKKGYFRYWAPGKALFRDGKYYLFPTIVKPDESMGTYVMVAESPEGPFRFTNGQGIFFNRPEMISVETKPLIDDIDGEPFVDDDGQAYVFWRRRNAARLSADWLSLGDKAIGIPTSFGGYSEGPVMFKRNGLYYYVYTLSGNANYCNGYMISRQSPLGPFEKPAGKGIFIYSDLERGIWGPGHGNVFQMPGTDDFYFLYLEYGEGGTTRQVFVNKMEFDANGAIEPMKVDFNGVGHLKNGMDFKQNLAFTAKASASSHMDGKKVTAIIAPDPNVLKTIKVNAENGKTVERWKDYVPENALDGRNGTCWRAAPNDSLRQFTVDLGVPVAVSQCEMAFTLPTYGHTWMIEKSNDGKRWKVCARQDDMKICSPHVANGIGKARYLKLTIMQGEPGLWEFKIYK